MDFPRTGVANRHHRAAKQKSLVEAAIASLLISTVTAIGSRMLASMVGLASPNSVLLPETLMVSIPLFTYLWAAFSIIDSGRQRL